MPDPVTPAMTPERWRRQLEGKARIKRTGEAEIGLGVYAMLGFDAASVDHNDAVTNPEFGCDPPYVVLYWETAYGRMGVHNPHALAALCLYQQPFGFTREDLADLHRAINPDVGFAAGEYAAWEDRMKHLAARIAALLPPEEDAP